MANKSVDANFFDGNALKFVLQIADSCSRTTLATSGVSAGALHR
jgi:hypothetical protein